MTTDLVHLPPASVRASFALLLGVVVLSLLNAVIQLAFRISGTTVLIGALIETGLFLLLGTHMRAGRQWARVALVSVTWVFVIVSLLALYGLGGAFDQRLTGQVAFILVYLTVKLSMIVTASLLMYQRGAREYFH